MRHRKSKNSRRTRDLPYKSKLEEQYAAHLHQMIAQGELVRFKYEPFKMAVSSPPVASEARWTADWWVVTSDGVEVHETKGYERDSDVLRIKAVAEWIGVPVFMVKKVGGRFVKEQV